jgi:hypothetical protein
MELYREVARRGMLPLPELFERFERGEIPRRLFKRLLVGQVAQKLADELDDADPRRTHFLDRVAAAEDWFQEKMRAHCR